MLSRSPIRLEEELLPQRGRIKDELAPPATDPSGENELAIRHMAEDALEQFKCVVDRTESGFVLVYGRVYGFNAKVEPRQTIIDLFDLVGHGQYIV